MEIIVKLTSSPEGTQGLAEGCQGEAFQVLSSPNNTKVDIISPKGERFTVCAEELIKAIRCCTKAEPAISWPWWYTGTPQTSDRVIITNTGSNPTEWFTDGTCAVKTNSEI